MLIDRVGISQNYLFFSFCWNVMRSCMLPTWFCGNNTWQLINKTEPEWEKTSCIVCQQQQCFNSVVYTRSSCTWPEVIAYDRQWVGATCHSFDPAKDYIWTNLFINHEIVGNSFLIEVYIYKVHISEQQVKFQLTKYEPKRLKNHLNRNISNKAYLSDNQYGRIKVRSITTVSWSQTFNLKTRLHAWYWVFFSIDPTMHVLCL